MKRILFIISILLFLLSGTSHALAETDTASTTNMAAITAAFDVAMDASSTAATSTQLVFSFEPATSTVASGAPAEFRFALEGSASYTISFHCPLGITSLPSERDVCAVGSGIASTTDGTNLFMVTFINEATTDQKVAATLTAYDASSTEIRSLDASVTIAPPPSLRATVTSFSVERNIPGNTFSSALSFTARFTGKNIDTYRIRMNCPVPATVESIRERLTIIEADGAGFVTSLKEGTECSVTQTASASAELLVLHLDNPFTTPQAVGFTLQAYSWDGKKDVFGEEQSKFVVVSSK